MNLDLLYNKSTINRSNGLRRSVVLASRRTACSELCSIDRSPGAKAISHGATTTPAALAAGLTSNHVQVDGTDVQGPDHIDAGVSESSHQAT